MSRWIFRYFRVRFIGSHCSRRPVELSPRRSTSNQSRSVEPVFRDLSCSSEYSNLDAHGKGCAHQIVGARGVACGSACPERREWMPRSGELAHVELFIVMRVRFGGITSFNLRTCERRRALRTTRYGDSDSGRVAEELNPARREMKIPGRLRAVRLQGHACI